MIKQTIWCLSRLFADDTSLPNSSSSLYTIEDIFNCDVKTLAYWSEQWLVKYNPQKRPKHWHFIKKIFLVILIYSYKAKVWVFSNHKHLGITFDANGKCHTHIENIIKSASNRLCALKKLKYILNRNFLSRVYIIL